MIEESPFAVGRFEIGGHSLNEVVLSFAGGLSYRNVTAQLRKIITKVFNIRGSGNAAMSRDERRVRMFGEKFVESGDPRLGRSVDQIGKMFLPDDVAAENDIAAFVIHKDYGIAAGMAWHKTHLY